MREGFVVATAWPSALQAPHSPAEGKCVVCGQSSGRIDLNQFCGQPALTLINEYYVAADLDCAL